jgi:hypothetical protein
MATNSDETDLHQSDADDLDPDSDFDGPRAAGASPPRFGRLALCVAAAGALSLGVIGTVAYGVWFNHDQQAYVDAITSARRALGSSEPAGTRGFGQSAAQPGAWLSAPPVAVAQRARDDDAVAAAVAPATSGQTKAHETSHPDAATWTAAAQPPASAIPDDPDPAAMSMQPATTRQATGEQSNGHAVWSGQIQPGAPAVNPSMALAEASPAMPLAMSPGGSTSASSKASPDTLPDLYGTPGTPAAPAASAATTRHAANRTNAAGQQSASNRTAKGGKLAQQDQRAAPSNAKHSSGLFARVGEFFRRVSYRQHGSGRQQQQQDIYSHP